MEIGQVFMIHVLDEWRRIYGLVNYLMTENFCKNSERLKAFSGNIYLFKFNNRNTRKRCEICSKLTIKIPNDVNDVVLVFLLLTLNIFRTFF